MAFQMGFPKKLNVPQRKIQNKSMGDFNQKARKGRMDIDNIGAVNKNEIDVIRTNKMPEIKGESLDICC